MNTDTTAAAATTAAATATAPATAPATTTTTAPAVGKAARERAVRDREAARLIEAKKAEEKAAREASRKAGQSPETPETMAPGVDAVPDCPGFVSRPDTKEKRKVDWRANAPALYSICAALPRDVASARAQIAAGKFDPTARRARFDVPKMEAYARELPLGSVEREGLFFLIQSAYRSAALNDIPRRECRSGTLTLFSETGGVTGSRKGYTPHDA